MIKAILFDLDETLIMDEVVTQQAYAACAKLAASRHPLDPEQLVRDARAAAKELWSASPTVDYCRRIGHSPDELLWASYSQPTAGIQALARFVEGYRLQVWRTALAKQAIADEDLLPSLVEHWISSRSSYPWYPDVEPLLQQLRKRYLLGIVTNGVPDLQRRKIAGAGLEKEFEAIAISGELDIGKPERGIFDWICSALGVEGEACVMVGDNPERDIAGGRAAGMRTVLINRGHKPADVRFPADLELSDLGGILPWLHSQL